MGSTNKYLHQVGFPPRFQAQKDPHIEEMQRLINLIMSQRTTTEAVRSILSDTQSLFLLEIVQSLPLAQFKMPTIPPYDGKIDPALHVQNYKAWMTMAKVNHAILCDASPLVLIGPT